MRASGFFERKFHPKQTLQEFWGEKLKGTQPVWCHNILKVTGTPFALKQFCRAARGHSPWGKPEPGVGPAPLCFHSLMAIPNSVLEAGYSPSGHNWEVEHWGCFWGACNSWIRKEKGKLIYRFDTVGFPPLKFLTGVSISWPGLPLEMSYLEELGGLQGGVSIKAGTFRPSQAAERTLRTLSV